jgi:antitoxin (DNA-binding transcriptional repressor) of toxin-antitoxin stability system
VTYRAGLSERARGQSHNRQEEQRGRRGAYWARHPAGIVDLIIRYHGCMRTITATEASRNFSDLLDAIERGETVTITRGHHVVAEMRPARRRTGADLRTALDDIPPPDERFAADIAGAVALLTSEGADPWAGA